MTVTRATLAQGIAQRLRECSSDMQRQWQESPGVRSCLVDDLLPDDAARQMHAAFPTTDRMMYKRSIRENKHVAAQMNLYAPILEDAVFAFQHGDVIAAVAEITGLKGLEPDPELYAGGISLMAKGAYLRPHLDNSHDRTRARYRTLNLLFYVTPDWSECDGGTLQLWDEGPQGAPRTIASAFNRLVIMATDEHSWHSVSEVTGEDARCCVSNYYFSRTSPSEKTYFHATSFRQEYGRGVKDKVMRADNALRSMILRTTGNLLYRNPHGYKRED